MKEKVESNLTGRQYYPDDVVRIVNYRQAAAYIAHDAQLIDIYPSTDFKTNTPILVFIFNRADTHELYDLWCKHELN